jgi:hypothetical protein
MKIGNGNNLAKGKAIVRQRAFAAGRTGCGLRSVWSRRIMRGILHVI